jgi:hypothetical protein
MPYLIKWLIKNGDLIKELIKVVARWFHLWNEDREKKLRKRWREMCDLFLQNLYTNTKLF